MAQEPAPKRVHVEVEKKDATFLKGKLLGIARDSVRLLDENNVEHLIAMKEIRNIDYIDTLHRKGRWFDAPNTMRYLLTSTAIPLRKKEIALHATYLFLISAQYGISDRVSIGAGTDIISQSFNFVTAKVNIINEAKYKFSTGINYYRLPRDFITTNSNEDIRDLGMVYGAGTWGNQNSHLTLGAGYIYAAGSFLPPIVTLSGTVRLAKHFALVTENWFFLGNDSQTDVPVLISLGVRYLTNRSSIDLAFYNDQEFSLGAGLPYVGYSFRISRKKR